MKKGLLVVLAVLSVNAFAGTGTAYNAGVEEIVVTSSKALIYTNQHNEGYCDDKNYAIIDLTKPTGQLMFNVFLTAKQHYELIDRYVYTWNNSLEDCVITYVQSK